MIREYSRIMLSILQDGVEQKVFRADFNMNIVRDIIFGTLEWEVTTCLATQEIACKVESIDKRVNSSTLDIIESDADILKNLEVGLVTIKTKKAIVIKNFNEVQELGRFVLVQDENICAGGIITESDK